MSDNIINITSTGIPNMDELLKGGIEKDTLSAIWVNPGVDGVPFAYQIACSASKTTKVFYLVNSKNTDSAKNGMKSLGLNPSKISFIDSYSALIGAKSTSNLIISNPKDVNEIINDISVIVKKTKNPLIILDSLSALIDLTEQENTDFLFQLKKLRATIVCLFTEWPYNPKFIESLKDVFDIIIELKAMQERIFFRQYFSVTKLKAKRVKTQSIPYRVMKAGGIKVYIPKILVTGPFNSGKTSFIHSASTRAVSVDRLGTTIALDHGHVSYRGFSCDLFGTPGQERFDPILKLLGSEALGVVVVVSATDPASYKRAVEMVKKTETAGLPTVVAANKANLRGALPNSAIRNAMGLANDVPMVRTRATDLTKVQPGLPCQLKKEDVEMVLDSLFDTLFKK